MPIQPNGLLRTVLFIVAFLGQCAPGAGAGTVENSGTNRRLTVNEPRPIATSLADIATGRFENQRVTFTGTVRHCTVDKPVAPGGKGEVLKLTLATTGQTLDVLGYRPEGLERNRIIDSTVSMVGVAGSYRNRKGQFLAAVVTADRKGDVRITDSGPADPFGGVVAPIGELLTSVDRNRGDHRIRIRGVVTYYLPEHELYVQEGHDAIRVQTPEKVALKTGDLVDVVGFEATSGSSPHLEDGIIKKVLERIPSPERPLRTTWAQIVEGELDARLVQVEGTIFDIAQRPNELLIVLQNGKNMIGAYLPGIYRGNIPGLQAGARVEFTGVASLIFDENHRAKAFTLHLRAASDARLLKSAPWWNTKRALTLLAGAGSVIVLIVLWIILLRKRVNA